MSDTQPPSQLEIATRGSSVHHASGFYIFPPMWMGEDLGDETTISRSRLEEIVISQGLPSGIHVDVSRDGLIRFDFSETASGALAISRREFDEIAIGRLAIAKVANAYLACLDSTWLEKRRVVRNWQTVGPNDMLIFSRHSDGSGGVGMGDPRFTELYGRRYASPPSVFGVRRFGAIPADVIEESFAQFANLLRHPSGSDWALTLAELFARSCEAFEQHNYSLSLVVAWAITEKLIGTVWKEYVEEASPPDITMDGVTHHYLNNRRRQELFQGPDFSASIIAHILCLAGKIDLETFIRLAGARAARNKWLHELKPAARANSEDTIRLTQKLLAAIGGVNLQSALVSRV